MGEAGRGRMKAGGGRATPGGAGRGRAGGTSTRYEEFGAGGVCPAVA